MRNYDIEFLKHFSMIIAFLVLVTLGLILGSMWLHADRAVAAEDVDGHGVESRLQSYGGVYAGETGAAAMAAAAEEARAAAASQVAYGGSEDGAVIYPQLCGACHGTGAGGAPKMEQAAWTERLGQGEETLIKHAIDGYTGPAGMMPARGGNPALTDAQVAETVKWMLVNLK